MPSLPDPPSPHTHHRLMDPVRHSLLKLAVGLLVGGRGRDRQGQGLAVQVLGQVDASQAEDGGCDVLVGGGGLQHLPSLDARTPEQAGRRVYPGGRE